MSVLEEITKLGMEHVRTTGHLVKVVLVGPSAVTQLWADLASFRRYVSGPDPAVSGMKLNLSCGLDIDVIETKEEMIKVY